MVIHDWAIAQPLPAASTKPCFLGITLRTRSNCAYQGYRLSLAGPRMVTVSSATRNANAPRPFMFSASSGPWGAFTSPAIFGALIQ